MSVLSTFDKRRVATVVVVLLVAFLSGHVMQTILRDEPPMASVRDAPDAAPVIRRADEPKPLPTPPAATLMPILERPPVLPERATEPSDDALEARADPCQPRAFATPAVAAMVTLTLRAPCHPGAEVILRQGPLVAAQATDGEGRLSVRLPALETDVVVEVEIGGAVLKAEARVRDAEDYRHIALAWHGPQMLRLNAFEFGAARNEIGHVWSGSPKTPRRASRGSGGFLTRLVTDEGPSVEVYSLPVSASPLRGVVRLVAEARVTRESCGRVVKAKAFQPTAFRRLSETDVEVALPDCDRLGEVVLLQNLLRDVRLAGR